MPGSLTIVADRQITLAKKAFAPFGQLHLVDGRQIERQQLKQADVLLVRSVTRVDKKLLQDTPVKFVGSATAGIDHIDVDYLASANIHFHAAPGSNAQSVAEYIISCLLNLAQDGCFSLADKTVGIVGVGHVGSCLHTMLQGLGVNCLLNDPPRADREGGPGWSSLEALYDADILTFHTPLTTSGPYATVGMINRQLLDNLKDDVTLINTARGGIVNENDLLAHMEDRPDTRLILDVWANEPDINIELLKLAWIATPHIAGYSFDGKLKATRQLATALSEWSSQSFSWLPEDSDSLIEIRPGTQGSLLLQSVNAMYDVRDDSEKLKVLLSLKTAERGPYFDNLRKTYPLRREFNRAKLCYENLSPDEQGALKAMGFRVENR